MLDVLLSNFQCARKIPSCTGAWPLMMRSQHRMYCKEAQRGGEHIMSLDIVLAVAAALVAICGIVYDPKDARISVAAVKRICDLRSWSLESAAPRVLIFIALGI